MRANFWQYRYWLLIALIPLLALLVLQRTNQTTQAELASTGATIQAMGHIRIREAPSINATRLSYIPWGESAKVLALNETGDWYQIDYNGIIGWSASEWFRVVDGQVSVAPVTAKAVEPANVGSGFTVMALDNIRIRAQPSIKAERLGSIPWGEQVPVLAVDTSGEWYQINYEGLTGWSAADWFQKLSGSSTTVAQAQAATHVRATGNVRLRTQPNTQSDIIDTIYVGNIALLLGSDSTGQWYLVRYKDKEGWSFGEYLAITTDPIIAESTTSQAVVSNPPAQPVSAAPATTTSSSNPAPTPSSNTETVASVAAPSLPDGTVLIQTQTSVAPIYASPDVTSGTLGVVRRNGQVVLLDVDKSKTWYQINHNGLIGWVNPANFEAAPELVDAATTPSNSDDATLARNSNNPSTSPIGSIMTVSTSANAINIMPSPKTSGTALEVILPGDQVTILALDSTQTWYQINHAGTIGWIPVQSVQG